VVDSAVNRKYLWFVLGIISLLVYYYGQRGSSEDSSEVYVPVKKPETAEQFA
jgi:hypothetical protein